MTTRFYSCPLQSGLYATDYPFPNVIWIMSLPGLKPSHCFLPLWEQNLYDFSWLPWVTELLPKWFHLYTTSCSLCSSHILTHCVLAKHHALFPLGPWHLEVLCLPSLPWLSPSHHWSPSSKIRHLRDAFTDNPSKLICPKYDHFLSHHLVLLSLPFGCHH